MGTFKYSQLNKNASKSVAILKFSVFLLFFIFYAWLSYHIPFTADDWQWGTAPGIEELLNATKNSRYAGNLFVVIMTRSAFLNMLIMATVSSLLPILIIKLAKKCIKEESSCTASIFLFMFANVLYLSAGSRIFSETNGWIAGFANFVISSVFVLVNWLAWMPIFDSDHSQEKDSALTCIFMFFMTFVGQLFIENLTLVTAITSTAFLFIYYCKTKHISLKYVMMTVGSYLGLLIMFSSSMYETLFHTGVELNGYREILFLSKNSIGELLYSIIYQCARLVVRIGEENTVLTISILIALALRLINKAHGKTAKFFAIGNLALCIYYLVVSLCNVAYREDEIYYAMIAAAINALYIVLVIAELCYLCHYKYPDAKKLLFLWIFALFTIVPLIFTSENGARLLYTFETIAIVLVVALIYPLIKVCSPKRMIALLSVALIIAMLLSTRLIVIYSANKACEHQRREMIATAIADNQEKVVVPLYPYPKYASRATPVSDEAMEHYKNFFEIPENIEIVFE